MRNLVSSLIMLSAGLVAVLCCILMSYTLESTLIVLTTVLFVFMIIGFIAQKIIDNMTKEAEERFRREEEKRREEEALALAEAEAAALAEAERLLETQSAETDSFPETVSAESMYFTEPVE